MLTETRSPDRPETDISSVPGSVRPGGDLVGAPAPPPEELGSSGGGDPTAEARRRSADALFRRRVDAIHRQLLPVRSRTALASSYGREAGMRSVDGVARRRDEPVTALQVAYALRWLELAEPAAVASWAELLEGPLD